MREIVLDTETTGLSPKAGHKVVEIGCLELKNHIPTGNTFHCYINPDRDMPEEAFKVHGLSGDFLKDFPLFGDHADSFMDFLEDSPLIIHNAEFDLRFLNAELEFIDRPTLQGRPVIDTVLLARKKFPGAPANLDALCKRFQIDISKRTLHGALIDCELLAEVYIELLGGRQRGFSFAQTLGPQSQNQGNVEIITHAPRPLRPSRNFTVSPEELERHTTLVDDLKDPLWRKNMVN